MTVNSKVGRLKPGVHEQIFSRRGQRYTIAIPGSYAGGNVVPLVVVLHWGGVVTPFYGKSILAYLVEPAWRELGAIIVAPDCVHGDWTNPQSESEIIALLEYLQDSYNIDADRRHGNVVSGGAEPG
jgi:predicted peptidase